MLQIFEIPLQFEPQKPEPTYELRVSLTYKDNGIYEDVAFQSLDIFNVIKDDVNMHDWRFVRNDGEVIADGKNTESLELFYKNLEKNIKKYI